MGLMGRRGDFEVNGTIRAYLDPNSRIFNADPKKTLVSPMKILGSLYNDGLESMMESRVPH